MVICALVKQSQTPVKAFGAGAPRRIAGSYDMKNPQAIFDKIAALQQLKLPRFGGHRTICVRGVHDGQDKRSLPA